MSKPKNSELEELLFSYIDKVKVVISNDMWGNILLNCTKNEVFILLLLYRKGQATMSQAAEYIDVPLNTATGIAVRMEKRSWILRERSPEDKRIVTISLTETGLDLVKQIMSEFTGYAVRVLEVLSPQELEMMEKVFEKVVQILNSEKSNEQDKSRKLIKKIPIE